MSYDPSEYTPPNGAAVDFNLCSSSEFPFSGGLDFDLRESVDFDFTDPYTPSNGGTIRFCFGPCPVAGDVDPGSCLQKSYSSEAAVVAVISVEGALQKSYVSIPEVNLEPVVVAFNALQSHYSTFITTTTRPEGWLPYKTGSGNIRCPWNKSVPQDKHVRVPWAVGDPTDPTIRVPFAEELKKEVHVRVPWGDFPKKDPHPYRILWGSTEGRDKHYKLPWITGIWKDLSYRFPWEVLPSEDKHVRIPFKAPPRKYLAWGIPWGVYDPEDRHIRFPWITPDIRDRHHSTVWGRMAYERICTRDYVPDVYPNINLNLEVDINLIGTGDHIDFYFAKADYDERCTQRDPSGWRDKWPPPIIHEVTYVPSKVAYNVLNSCSVVRLPERTPIHVQSVNISTDFDSWCWKFSMAVRRQADIDLIAPSGATFYEIEVDINGVKWEFLVERWSESWSFGKKTWSVSGSSKSAELAKPYDPLHTRIETNVRNAHQIVNEELSGTGFSSQWDTVDWLVPADVYSYNDSTTMQAVNIIAEAIGSKIQSHRTDKTLIFLPRYVTSPWTWAGGSPDIVLPEDVFKEISREYDTRPTVTGVYVSGQTQGRIVFVKRQGTPGTLLAPMVTNPLITHVDAGKERGRIVIAESGEWVKIGLNTFLRSVPAEGPTLVSPGDLVKVTGVGGDWFGQAVSVSIQAAWGSNGLVVGQSIGVERYYGS